MPFSWWERQFLERLYLISKVGPSLVGFEDDVLHFEKCVAQLEIPWKISCLVSPSRSLEI